MRYPLALLCVAVLGLGAAAPSVVAADDLRQLVADLGGGDGTARGAAWRELAQRLDPAALPLLREAIPTWDHIGQYYGLLVLDRYPPRPARRSWRKLFEDDTPFVRVWAGMALLRGGDEGVVDGIVAALRTPVADATVRYRTLSRVGWPRDARLREAVRDHLVVGAPLPVLVQVVALLHRYRDREAVGRMRGLLQDPRAGARALAAAWLVDAGEVRQARVLAADLAAGVGYAEFVQITRMLAANRRVADEILDAVAEHALEEPNVSALLQQIAFLGQHRHARARPVLKKLLLHRDERVSRAAFDVLVSVTDTLREDTIGLLLAGDDVDKRLWAAEALRQRDDERGLPVVAAVLRGGTVPQRTSAATLLASFTVDEAVEPLLGALDDAHPDVRKAAFAGLQALVRRLLPYRTLQLGLTGYAPDAPEEARAAGIAALHAWWVGVRDEGM